MYLLGLRALGHEVFYIEDTGECVYDPVQNTRSTDPSYGTSYIHSALEPFGLGDRWAFVNYDGSYHGKGADEVRAFCADADLFVNLSGGSWFWRDEYARIPRKVFIDSDPAFTQLAIAKAEPWYVKFFQGFDHLFTFGSNIGTAGVDDSDRRLQLAQDVAAGDARRLAIARPRPVLISRSVMTWQIESFTDVGGNKDQEFVRFIDLPSKTHAALRARDQRPADSCCASTAGTRWTRWACRARLWDYREFIQRSRAEFGVAKHTYVASRSGWFSDRTECYLASGRPAIVQDTGWTAHLPHGDGLLAFSTPERGARRHRRDQRRLRPARTDAAEIAREHFDARRVLRRSSSRPAR